MQWEISAFKQLLRWCSQHGMYTGKAYEYVFKLQIKNRRSGLTLAQYRTLYTYMRSKQYLIHATHGIANPKYERHRMLLRCYILFMINTGLRPGEARNLKWNDITYRVNKLGVEVVQVRIAAAFSKVRKERNVIGRHTAKRALERYREYLRGRGETAADNDYIFGTIEGATIADLREGFQTVLKDAGVGTDIDGALLVPYSLRHSYAQFRLQYGANVSVFKLAQNMGTSVAMIEQFYSESRNQDFIDSLS